jgi:hypothetical protein
VRRLTVVPFLPDGRCALVPAASRLHLPTGSGSPATSAPRWLRRPTGRVGRWTRLAGTATASGCGLLAEGGRLLVSSYVPVGDRSRHADRILERLGFAVDGRTDPAQADGRGHPPSAWIDRR